MEGAGHPHQRDTGMTAFLPMTTPWVSVLVSLLPTLFMAGCVFLAARRGGRS